MNLTIQVIILKLLQGHMSNKSYLIGFTTLLWLGVGDRLPGLVPLVSLHRQADGSISYSLAARRKTCQRGKPERGSTLYYTFNEVLK
jgi:hypothetical protein